jgi:hypothetical protein
LECTASVSDRQHNGACALAIAMAAAIHYHFVSASEARGTAAWKGDVASI